MMHASGDSLRGARQTMQEFLDDASGMVAVFLSVLDSAGVGWLCVVLIIVFGFFKGPDLLRAWGEAHEKTTMASTERERMRHIQERANKQLEARLRPKDSKKR